MTRTISPQPLYRILVILVLAAVLCVSAGFMSTAAYAQNGVSDDDTVEYVFKRNDTLLGLAGKYFRRSADYRPIMRYNRIVNDRSIPVGYTLQIPYRYLKYEKSAGRITAFRGDAAIARGAGNTQQAIVGAAIAEGNVLATGAASSLSMSFSDGSIVTMPSNSVIRITRLRKILLTDSIDYEFALDRGGIRSKVTPFKQRNDRYRTRTPIAVSAVRGTDFRNRYDPDSSKAFAELVEGGLDLATPELAEEDINLEPGFGAAASPDGVIKAALLPPPDVTAGTGTQKRETIVFALAGQSEATGYRVQIAKDSGFIDIVKDERADDETLTVTDLDNGNYFAKFTAFADNGLEGLPQNIAFKRRLNDVKASTSITDTGYNFRWGGAGEGKRVYHFQLYSAAGKSDGAYSPSGAAFVEQAGMTVDGIIVSDLPPGTYYWRVGTQLFTEGELDQSWTDFENFTVESAVSAPRGKLRRRLWIEWGAIALLATALITALSHFQGTGRFDNILYDLASGLRPDTKPENITIIGIDEESLSKTGRWPWPREEHIAAFEVLQKADTKAVAFDILLTEEDDPLIDQALSGVMAQTGNTFLPVQYVTPGTNGRIYDKLAPAPAYLAAAKDTGHVNLDIDQDGVLRRMVPCFQEETDSDPKLHLMEILYRYGEGKASEATAKRDCTKSLLLPFEQRADFSYISYASLASGEIPPEFLNGQYVLIGATAGGLGDQYIVAGGGNGTMAGVTVMANYLNAMLADGFIKPVEGWWHIILSLLPSWILLIGLWRWQPRTTLYISAILLTVMMAATVTALYFSYWFAPGAALAGLALIYPTWGWRRLQATSSFMESELDRMDKSLPPLPLPSSAFEPVDIVTGQAEKMSHAISQMRDLRRFVSDTLTQLPDPMLVADLDGSILLSNDNADLIFGRDVEEQNIDELLQSYVTENNWVKVCSYLADARDSAPANGDASAYTEFSAKNALSYALRCSPVRSGDNAVRGYIFYLADITSITNARREREEVLQLLSHDMRAPQSAILALLEKKEGKVAGDVRKRISQQAHRTLNLADNFIDIARMKNTGFEPEDILLADMMHEAADGLWPLASARKITFTFDDRSEDAFIEGEQSSIFRAITNLYDNAIKYSPDGGEIHTVLRRLQLGNQDHVRAQIIDQGGGISDNILPELFGKFVSRTGEARARVQGIGLGLHHVESVITRHGGEVGASNAKDGGAIFTILLPVSAEPDA